MKKIIVFGGSGFLGSHVCDKLSENKHEVTIFDTKNSSYLKSNQKIIIGDILSYNDVKKAVIDQDIVFNFAGLSDLDAAKNDPLGTINLNILGNANILEASKQNNIKRFIFASTVYVYSNLGGFYRISKQASENYIENFREEFDLNYTILRYGSLYGLRSDKNNGIYKFIFNALKNNSLQFNGSPESMREFIHVEDAADCTVSILDEKFKNKHIIITGHQSISIDKLLKMICDILPNKDIKIIYDDNLKTSHYKTTPYAFNPRFAKKIVPESFIDLGQGLLQIVEHINEELNIKRQS